MNYPLFFGLVGFLGALYIWIGKKPSQNLQTSDDYFLILGFVFFRFVDFPLPKEIITVALSFAGNCIGRFAFVDFFEEAEA